MLKYTAIVVVLLVSLIGIIISYWLNVALSLWLFSGLSLFSVAWFLGLQLQGQWWGILIDERNKISLSRFQAMLWTITIFSAIATILIERANTKVDGIFLEVMAIEMPPEIWGLLGISLGSTVTATAIKFQRDSRITHNNREPQQARFPVDMFRGEELADYASVDITKFQLFILTLLIWGGYVVALAEKMVADGLYVPVFQFPEFSGGLVAIYGISQAGYLGAKAVPKSEAPVVEIEQVKNLGANLAFEVTMRQNSSIVNYEIQLSRDGKAWDSQSDVDADDARQVYAFGLGELNHGYNHIRVIGFDQAGDKYYSKAENLPLEK